MVAVTTPTGVAMAVVMAAVTTPTGVDMVADMAVVMAAVTTPTGVDMVADMAVVTTPTEAATVTTKMRICTTPFTPSIHVITEQRWPSIGPHLAPSPLDPFGTPGPPR